MSVVFRQEPENAKSFNEACKKGYCDNNKLIIDEDTNAARN